MSSIIGVDCKAYRNTGADYANPTWTEVTNLRDVSLGISVEEFDATVRGVSFGQYLPTLIELEVTASALWVKGDTGIAAILTAFWGRTYVDLVFVDDDIENSGADGIRAAWGVFGASRGEALREGVTYDLTFKPFATGDSDLAPQRWVTAGT